ncbi:hypothetical protein [Natrialba magadii]|nr:hypothetical protein [Natrialba magadii]
MRDAEKIATYERYRAGDITEDEVRERLGDDVIDGMREDREAFEEAVDMCDTSDFLQDDEG